MPGGQIFILAISNNNPDIFKTIIDINSTTILNEVCSYSFRSA
jgi:hypothetical protein